MSKRASVSHSVGMAKGGLPELLRQHYHRKCMTSPSSIVFQNEPSIRTIGRPIYKAPERDDYDRFNAQWREYFLREYGALYAFVVGALSDHFRAPARISNRFAPPGFHIIQSSTERPFHGGSLHRDHFSHRIPEIEGTIHSGTLLLSPEPDCHGVVIRDDASEQPEFFSHQPGRLTLFDGALQHAIAGIDPAKAHQRITLQLHVMQGSNGIEIFW